VPTTLAPPWLAVPADLNDLDPALWPASTRRAVTGEIGFAGRGVKALLAAHGSPLYVLDEQEFRARARRFSTAFMGWDVYYAAKAFLCTAVARWAAQEGLGLDVCSGNELAVALAGGYRPDRIEFHGNNKTEAELDQAVTHRVGRIVVDSFQEIDRLEAVGARHDVVVPVVVRVTTDVRASTDEHIVTGTTDQKFGFPIASGEALRALLACLDRPHLNPVGIHSHIGSQIMDVAELVEAGRRVLELAVEYRHQTGATLGELNFGGGFGIAYTSADHPATPAELRQGFAPVVDAARRQYGLERVRFAIEPGRGIVGPAGVALYTVGTVKPVEVAPGAVRTYVSVDGGMSDNIRPALYQANYTAVLANRRSSAAPMLCRVVGKHCESGDIVVRDVYLPADLVPGDILAVPAAGAYTRSMASNYNHATRPAVVGVGLTDTRVLLRAETLDDLLALDAG